ncbi:MAG: hypothetical protein ACYCXF_05010 [Thermoleophilia bacterium]
MPTERSVPAGESNFNINPGGHRLQVTAYTHSLKITGIAYVGLPTRTTSRRPSDILFYYPEDFLKLAEVRVTDRNLNKIIDEPPYIIINMRQVDAIHAEDIDADGSRR